MVNPQSTPTRVAKNPDFFGIVFGPWKNWPQMAPNGARRFFFLLIQTLPTFLAERILILRFFSFLFSFGSPNLWVRCRRRFSFSEKWHPYVWKPLTCGYVAAGAFFRFRKMAPIFLEAPNLWLHCRRRLFCFQKSGLCFSPSATRVGMVCELTITVNIGADVIFLTLALKSTP